MAYIISKREGPRKEDAAAKHVIDRNRATIDGIANQLMGGRWQTMRNPIPEPQQPPASRKLWFASAGQAAAPQPGLRISLNGRVVVMDRMSGKQLHFLGQVRGGGRAKRFVLATAENGFSASLEAGPRDALADLDGYELPDEAAAERFEAEISSRLSISAANERAE